jgi:hypothetical protein
MEPRVIEHKGLGIRLVIQEPAALKQGDLERFGDAIAVEAAQSRAQQRGANVRAAIAAGWILEPTWTADQVGQQKPAVIGWISGIVDATYQEITTVPPE